MIKGAAAVIVGVVLLIYHTSITSFYLDMYRKALGSNPSRTWYNTFDIANALISLLFLIVGISLLLFSSPN